MGTEKSTVEIALRRLDRLTYLGFSKMNDPVNEGERERNLILFLFFNYFFIRTKLQFLNIWRWSVVASFKIQCSSRPRTISHHFPIAGRCEQCCMVNFSFVYSLIKIFNFLGLLSLRMITWKRSSPLRFIPFQSIVFVFVLVEEILLRGNFIYLTLFTFQKLLRSFLHSKWDSPLPFLQVPNF